MPLLDSRSLLLGIASLLQRMLRPLRLRVPRRIAGHRIYFDPATDVGLQLLLTGRFEAEALAQCLRFIRPDGVVIDVGANIGVHTLHYATHLPRGTVLALEPSRATFALLLRNVRALANVIPLNVALAESSGVRPFFIAVDDAHSGLKNTLRKRVQRQESVAVFTGDELLIPLLGNRRVDLVKIDVEGFEMEVLLGMKQLILAQKPVIFCEIFGGRASNPDPPATVRFCVSLGYEAHVLKAGRLTAAGLHDDRYYNYFFIPRRGSD